MGCCGRKREQLLKAPTLTRTVLSEPGNRQRSIGASTSAISAQPVVPGEGIFSMGSVPMQSGRPTSSASMKAGANQKIASGSTAQIHIRYRSMGLMRVRGPVSGRIYEFSVMKPVHPVDQRDAPELLKMRCFVRG